MRGLLASCAAIAICAISPAVLAWDAVGHRMITYLALDGMSADAPAFLAEPLNRDGVAWQSAEPDRWRSVRSAYLVHENAMDHFMDVEDLEPLGFTLSTIPPLRYRYVRDLTIARKEHPSGIKDDTQPYNEALDPTGQKEFPGFAPYAIMESHAKLISSFKTYRMLTRLNDPKRAAHLEMAKANIMVQMGILSHYVGDCAQPLHTTKHFNGWVGENPNGYTTAKTFHALIDGGLFSSHDIEYRTLKPLEKYDLKVDAQDPWKDVLAFIQRSFDEVEPLYVIEKKGQLQADEGGVLLRKQLLDAGAMLAALYNSAWAASAESEKEIESFRRFDSFTPGEGVATFERPKGPVKAPETPVVPPVPKGD